MKTTVVQWFQWFGEAMTHALGSFNDRHLQPPPIGTQPYRDSAPVAGSSASPAPVEAEQIESSTAPSY